MTTRCLMSAGARAWGFPMSDVWDGGVPGLMSRVQGQGKGVHVWCPGEWGCTASSNASWVMVAFGAPSHMWTDRHEWKNSLPATSLSGGHNQFISVDWCVIVTCWIHILTYLGTTTSKVVRYSESRTKCSFLTMSPRFLASKLPLKCIYRNKEYSVKAPALMLWIT